MKLYTVTPIYRNRTHNNGPQAPRYDLRPMNHAAACNWMDACRNHHTDYMIHPWPDDVPHPGPPLIVGRYRRDKDKQTATTD